MAIALDATSSTAVGASPRTIAHTCTGSDRVLLVATYCPVGDFATGVTYNSVAMTKIGTRAGDGAGNTYSITLWYLANPSTGANNIVATASSGTIGIQGVSYTGAAQSGIPDSSATNVTTSGTSLTTSTTVVASNCWLVMVGSDGGGNPVAGTGATARITGTPGAAGLWDSNGTVGTGSQSMQFTWTPAQHGNSYILSIAPSVTSTSTSSLLLMGVGT